MSEKRPPSVPPTSVSRRAVLGFSAMAACSFGRSDQVDGQEHPEHDDLAHHIDRLEAEYNGRFAIEARRLDAKGHFVRDENRVLPTASTCKLFILCELFRQAEAGLVNLDAPITWKPEFHRGGDGVLRAMVPGQQLSIHNMAILMMIISDNIATATLVDLLGAESVTRTMRSWGLASSDLHQGLPGGADRSRMQQPVSTAHDLCTLITRIYRHDVLTPKACDEIIRILRAQRCNDMLPRYIPVGEDWGKAETWIANKTGYGACRVEVGIVKTAEVTFSLAMFFKPQDPPRNRLKCLADYPPVLAMAHACRAVYESFG